VVDIVTIPGENNYGLWDLPLNRDRIVVYSEGGVLTVVLLEGLQTGHRGQSVRRQDNR